MRRRAVILISTNKGLCGALNSNVLREAAKLERETVFLTVGRKAAQFIARTKRQLAGEFDSKDAPLFAEARAISKFARDLFLNGEVGRVDVLYTHYYSTLVQRPELRPWLPVGKIEPLTAGVQAPPAPAALPSTATEFIFEPDAGQVLGALLPHSLNFQIFQILLEAKASEQSARMVAMKNATDNANKLIKDLTLEYNKLRQGNITNELLEIATAAMALG